MTPLYGVVACVWTGTPSGTQLNWFLTLFKPWFKAQTKSKFVKGDRNLCLKIPAYRQWSSLSWWCLAGWQCCLLSWAVWLGNSWGKVCQGGFCTSCVVCPTPAPPHHPTTTFMALPDNLGSWFSVCNLFYHTRRNMKKN